MSNNTLEAVSALFIIGTSIGTFHPETSKLFAEHPLLYIPAILGLMHLAISNIGKGNVNALTNFARRFRESSKKPKN